MPWKTSPRAHGLDELLGAEAALGRGHLHDRPVALAGLDALQGDGAAAVADEGELVGEAGIGDRGTAPVMAWSAPTMTSIRSGWAASMFWAAARPSAVV